MVVVAVAIFDKGPRWWCSQSYAGMGLPSCDIHLRALHSLPSWATAFLFPVPLLHLEDHHHLCIYVLHFLLDRRNHRKVEKEHSHRFGYYRRKDNDMSDMFSLVSQNVIRNRRQRTRKSSTRSTTSSGLARLEKVMVRVRVSRVYTL